MITQYAHVLTCYFEKFLLNLKYAKFLKACHFTRSFSFSMDGEQYAALANYLEKGVYPGDYGKGQKYSLRRSAKNYKLETGKLYYVDTQLDGTFLNRLVLKKNETERVF